ncbi:MAG: nucleotide exchange factor GrpE [Weeksellaceae bacterium]|nr:nucleotide exchange factor GrpE [Weeksellaceae bacterium]
MSENIINEEELNEETEIEKNQSSSDDAENEALKEELKNQKEQYLRLFAEFDNYKKRTAKERLEIFKTANSETVLALLPVIDDFERAITEIRKTENDEKLKGIELIQSKLIDTLRSKGLKKIEINTGDEFELETMEAVAQIPAPDEALQGKIVDVVLTGYFLTDKVIRHAKVIVGQ